MGVIGDFFLGIFAKFAISDTIRSLEIESKQKLKLGAILNAFSRYQIKPSLPKLRDITQIIQSLTIKGKEYQQKLENLKQRTTKVQEKLEVELRKEQENRNITLINNLNKQLQEIITNQI